MHKLLPKTAKNPHGFTLIELLVVISIIAILAVIGIAIFTGVTARARNAKRRADVQAVVGAFEANKDTTSSTYAPIIPNHFSGGHFPQDPNGTAATTPQYALLYVNNGTGFVVNAPGIAQWGPAAPLPSAAAGTNPAGGTLTVIAINDLAANPIPAVGTIINSFAICAQLEPEVIGVSTRTIYCRNSSQ